MKTACYGPQTIKLLRIIAHKCSQCLPWDHFLFMAVSSVCKVSKNLSSFPTGYNWVNQICNHDRARNVTFNDKFHYIRHDKPESKTHGPSFPCGMWPPREAAQDLLPGLRIPIQPLRLQKKLLLSVQNTDKQGFCKKKSPLSLQAV